MKHNKVCPVTEAHLQVALCFCVLKHSHTSTHTARTICFVTNFFFWFGGRLTAEGERDRKGWWMRRNTRVQYTKVCGQSSIQIYTIWCAPKPTQPPQWPGSYLASWGAAPSSSILPPALSLLPILTERPPPPFRSFLTLAHRTISPSQKLLL